MKHLATYTDKTKGVTVTLTCDAIHSDPTTGICTFYDNYIPVASVDIRDVENADITLQRLPELQIAPDEPIVALQQLSDCFARVIRRSAGYRNCNTNVVMLSAAELSAPGVSPEALHWVFWVGAGSIVTVIVFLLALSLSRSLEAMTALMNYSIEHDGSGDVIFEDAPPTPSISPAALAKARAVGLAQTVTSTRQAPYTLR